VVEFGDTIVREIMTPRVSMVCIRKNSTIEKLRELVIQKKHSRIPVYRDRIDNIEGVIVAKDLLEYSDDRHKSEPIQPLMREVFFVPESMRVAELLKELQKRMQKMAIVVDEHGGVSGLVTMEDLMEEIVGEIQDEYDTEQTTIVEKGYQDYIVLGDAEVEEVEELFDLELAEDDYITMGGLITHSLGRLPETGERFTIKGLAFEVLDVDQKRIKKIRIKKTDDPSGDSES
jgi:CBS domain containing-hemolysin-like protein